MAKLDYRCTKYFGKYGYSAIELMLVLALGGLIILFSIEYSNAGLSVVKAQKTAQQAYDYSKAVIRYISTHQNLLRDSLSVNGNSNGLIATVTPSVLIDEGFIKNNSYLQNNLKQYPCTIIYYNDNQLQSFIYYRSNGNDTQLDQNQLHNGLNHIGSMLGLYTNGAVISAAKDWSLESDFVQQMFIKQGTANISQGNNSAKYICDGEQIADNSYVVNVTSVLTLDNKAFKDDTLHQYEDPLHKIDDSLSNNQMNSDLIMDYKANSIDRKQSNLIFQMNPNCVMDSTNPATLQDYDPSVNGGRAANANQANSLGCRNRQLGISAMKDASNNPQITITGFNQATNSGSIPTYVGELRAASIQPTMKIPVGSACKKSEVGKMAQQKGSPAKDDINNIYVSQVICMKSPLCGSDTGGYCYMPAQSITIRYKPNQPAFSCPIGTFYKTDNIVISPAPQPQACHAHDCLGQPYDCTFNQAQYKTATDGIIPSDLLSNNTPPIYRTATVDMTVWRIDCGMHRCHFGCDSNGTGTGWPTQGNITQIDCTNDPSQASMVIQSY